MMAIKSSTLFVIILLINSLRLFSQENFIIEETLNYSNSQKNQFGQEIIHFDNAVNHPKFNDIPVLLKQLTLPYPIDSVSIMVFDSTLIDFNIASDIDFSQNIPQFYYEISRSKFQQHLNIYINPFISNGNDTKKIKQIKLLVTPYYSSSSKKTEKGSLKWAEHSVLATGDWIKVRISKSGIYKLTASQIAGMGLSINNIPLEQIRVYGNGGGMYPESNSGFFYDDLAENAIQVIDLNANNTFEGDDYILFYGQGPDSWNYNANEDRFVHKLNLYDNYAYYFITIKTGQGKRITNLPQETTPANSFITDFLDYAFYDRDSINLIKSGKQWFGNEYNILLNHNYSFNFPNLITSKPVKIRYSVAARSTSPSQFNISVNGNANSILVPAIVGTYNSSYAYGMVQDFAYNLGGNTISISTAYQKSTSASIGWMDYIEINANRQLSLDANQLIFRNPSTIGNGNISEFTLSNTNNSVVVWDISTAINPMNISVSHSTNNLSFVVKTDSLRQFIAHKGSYDSPEFVEKLSNQDLHAYKGVEYVICYHKSFENEAIELAQYHNIRNNLVTIAVDQELIFNEFSSGAKDIAALRNFMKMLYDRALNDSTTLPRYLLLFGDASFDYKNRISNNTNYVLTYESSGSLSPISSYSSDDFFGLLDDNEGLDCNGSLDIGIGRFPVSSVEEAQNLISKIKRYQQTYTSPAGDNANLNSTTISNMADWRNTICFIGDDQDDNIHISQSDYMAEYVRSNYKKYNIDKIYLDSYVQQTTPGGQRYPEAKRDLNLRVKSGALVLNYTGHGGEVGLAHESLLEVNDIQSWTNSNNLPLFITATCEFSRYEDPTRTSAGEYSYLQKNGGMIALLTTSRLTFSGSNFTLNKHIIQNMFPTQNGNHISLGDLNRISKVASGSVFNNRNFVLLGDPALCLSHPELDVKTLTINGTPISQFNDTLKALSTVTITGQIEENGQLLSSFNGYAYPTIFDKTQKFSTLGNDYNSYPFPFYLQKNIIYKGKVSVINGEFIFTFIVPKDINYAVGNGKISYYAENGQIDANGYFDGFLVGGSSLNSIVDNEGPQIRLFMNDTFFVDGGLTNQNPVLLGYLYDEHGINTTGNGIGHDIMLTLDCNSQTSLSLNNFYQAKTNSYQNGTVIYPFSQLTEGHHTLNLKAWDILNNSNSEDLNFVVVNDESTLISSVLAFPNPFTDFTSFVFEHNMAGNTMEIIIDIFDVDGSYVRNLNTQISNSGYKIAPEELSWNGTNHNGDRLKSGLYSYRITVQTDAGQFTSKSGKLILLN